MVDQHGWCVACGGVGWIDEDQAERLGLKIEDGRTEMCPICHGTGEPPIRSWKPFWFGLFYVLGVMMLGAIVYLQFAGLL